MSKDNPQGSFKNRLKEIRKTETSLTQSELAANLKHRGFSVSGAYISQIEAGLKHIPYGLAVAICEELGYDARRVTEIFLPEYFTGSLDEMTDESVCKNHKPGPPAA